MTDDKRDVILLAMRAAFDAGREQGEREAAAYEWGGGLSQNADSAFEDFMAEWNPDSDGFRSLFTSA